MSEADETTEQETPEQEEQEEDGATATGAGAKLRGALSKDSDLAQRPGFRNPANARSKAQKKKRSKGRKKR